MFAWRLVVSDVSTVTNQEAAGFLSIVIESICLFLWL